MEIYDKINSLKEKQKNILHEFENLADKIKEFDNINENEKLKNDIFKIRKEIDELSKKFNKVQDELQNTKLALREQVISEKMNILKISRQKIETYFEKELNSNLNSLDSLELKIKNKINEFINICNKNLTEEQSYFIKKLDDVSKELSQKIQAEKIKIKDKEQKLKKETKDNYEELRTGKITDEKQMEKRIKQNRIEMKIGLNVLNKVGIILILIGIGFFVYYNRHNINSYIKSIAVFSLGIISLIAGEIFYRRKKDVFSTGIISGGIAILYGGLFYSYFLLKILNMYPALLLSVLVSLVSIVLALRYNSQTIASFALIGGYLPFLSYIISERGLEGNEFYIGMIYLFILNLVILLISLFKDYQVPNFLSFILNIPCLIYLAFNCPNSYSGIAYTASSFFIYLLVVILNPIINKKAIKVPGLILLALSTTINATIIYLLFVKLELFKDFKGLLAIIFCLVYILISFLIKKFIPTEKRSFFLFYITSLTFAVLVIPFQLGIAWMTIGWLIEGILLVVFGYKRKIKIAEYSGLVIFGICLFFFYFFELFPKTLGVNIKFFEIKYASTIIGSLLIYAVYQIDLTKNIISEISNKGMLIKFIKYFTVITTYFFINYILIKLYNYIDSKVLFYNNGIHRLFIISTVSMSYAYLLLKIKYIYDTFLKIINIILNIAAIILFLYLLAFIKVQNITNLSLITGLILLFILNILVLLVLRDIVLRFIRKKNLSLEFYPLFIGIFLLINITICFISQLNFLANANVLMSFSYLILAAISIIIGFKFRYIYIRIYGLVLTFLALAKFFIIDLWFLSIPFKIISYFVFGILLIIISYIYQMIKHKIDKTEDIKNSKKGSKEVKKNEK